MVDRAADPPHDATAEQALIGAALLDAAVHDRVQVDAADFYRPVHETMWAALAELNGSQPDRARGLLDALSAAGDLKAGVLDGPYIHTCIDACTTPAAAGQYARVVLRHARHRRARQAVERATQRLATTDPDDLSAALYEAMGDLEAVASGDRAVMVSGLRDLTWLLTGRSPVIDPPTWCKRADGSAIFYAGRVNGIYGDPEAAKSWLAQVAIVEALTAGRKAVLIDVDHNGEALTTERLLLLGARPEDLADPDRFRYYEPDDGHELRVAVRELGHWSPQLAVLDSIGEMLPMLGVKSVDNDEITLALRTIASPLAVGGACVITIDHLPKAQEARSTGFAIGGTAKKRAIDGSYVHAETRIQPAPGQVGRVTLRIEKDRPGRLRATCTGKYIGTFVIDSTTPGITTTSIDRDSPITDEGVFRPTHLMELVSQYVEAHPGVSRNQIETSVRGKASAIREALERLIEEGFVQPVQGANRAQNHMSIAIYREAEDDSG